MTYGVLLRRLAALEGRAGGAGRCAACGGLHVGERLPLAAVEALLGGTGPQPCGCPACCPALGRLLAAVGTDGDAAD